MFGLALVLVRACGIRSVLHSERKIVEVAVVQSLEAAHALPLLASGMQGSVKPVQKVAALTNTTTLCKRCPKQVKEAVVEILPIVTGLVWDVKADVQAAAADALDAVCRCSGNSDLDKFIPAVISALKTPASLPDGVESLAGCVFVQEVEAPALAVLIPVLVRGLNFDKVDVKRKCCIIIENMCKLVEKPREVRPLMPKVKPLLEKEKEGFPITALREMNTLFYLNHPNIMGLKEIVTGSTLAKVYMVMEYCDHELKAILEEKTMSFTHAQTKNLVRQLLQGVEFMHKNWVMHRDLKTSNLLYKNESGVL